MGMKERDFTQLNTIIEAVLDSNVSFSQVMNYVSTITRT